MGKFFKARKKTASSLVAMQPPAAENNSPYERKLSSINKSRAMQLPGAESISLARVESHLLPLLDPAAFETEPYRMLAHMVAQLHKNADLRTLAISSPRPGDGKTSTAINLASILAQAPAVHVLLVEADLRRPSIAEYLGIRGTTAGLVEAITRPELSLDRAVLHYHPFNLDVLLARRPIASPADLFKLPRCGTLLQEARQHYDWVVIDTPPLLPFADCQLIEEWIDGFLVVVAANETPRKLLTEALNTMDPAKLIGLVLNKDDHQAPRYYHTYRYYDAQASRGYHKGWGHS